MRSGRKKGFSLVETLVAAGIFGSILAVAGFVSVQVMRSFAVSRATEDAVIRAVTTLERIGREVRASGVVPPYPPDGSVLVSDASTAQTRAVRVEVVSGGRHFFLTVAARNPAGP